MAEPKSLTCPHCEARLRRDAAAEPGARCPKCGGKLRPRGKKGPPPGPPRALIIGGIVLAVVVLGGGIGLSFWIYQKVRTDRPSVAVPTAFTPNEAPDKSFRYEYPADWKIHTEGAKDHYETTITRGSASIKITQGIVGSLLGDIAGAGDPGNDPERSPVARVHELKRAAATEGLSKYQEEKAQTVRTKFGDARVSAFTATAGTFSQRVRGYRATVLGHMTQFDILCQCPTADWENLEPVFSRLIAGFGPGSGL
jgi:hypothetical protein